jgi:integrase
VRFRAYGKRRYLRLGTADEGWTRRKAEDELANVLADVRRGIWRPHEPQKVAEPAPEPTFHQFASEWLEGLRHEGLSENTLQDYTWQLSNHMLPFFAKHRLSEITIAEVDRYRQEKVREGTISATSINKTITRLAQILEVAFERELIDRNPARGKRRRLKERKPERTWLDRAEQIVALLDAGGALDQEARADRRATPRRALLATLTLAGLRISEALDLRWRNVDLAAGCLRVSNAKTDAGVRQVDLLPALREELSIHKAQTRFGGPDDFIPDRARSAAGPQQRSAAGRDPVGGPGEREPDGAGPQPAARRHHAAFAAPHLHLASARHRRGGSLRHAPGRALRSEGHALDLRPGDVPGRGRAGAAENSFRRLGLGTAGHWRRLRGSGARRAVDLGCL